MLWQPHRFAASSSRLRSGQPGWEALFPGSAKASHLSAPAPAPAACSCRQGAEQLLCVHFACSLQAQQGHPHDSHAMLGMAPLRCLLAKQAIHKSRRLSPVAGRTNQSTMCSSHHLLPMTERVHAEGPLHGALHQPVWLAGRLGGCCCFLSAVAPPTPGITGLRQLRCADIWALRRCSMRRQQRACSMLEQQKTCRCRLGACLSITCWAASSPRSSATDPALLLVRKGCGGFKAGKANLQKGGVIKLTGHDLAGYQLTVQSF